MKRQTLTDARYHIIGFIDTAADGKQTARDARYRVLGHYDPRTDTTRDARHRMVGNGNHLASLVPHR